MSVVSNNILAGSSGQGEAAAFEIERSLRFNSADSSFLSRTPSSAGNRKTWTWSGWVKRTVKNTGTDQMLFTGGTASSNTGFLAFDFTSSDKLRLSSAGANFLITTAVYRDAGAWMHIVLAFDATQGTNANKVKLYANGIEVTAFDTDGRSSITNQDYGINQNSAHEIGRATLGTNKYFDGYLADVHFIDGQALAPTDFGLTDSNGVWQPKKYTGSYGTNGFHLEFKNNSSNAALGTDTSGNNNTWTVNNLVATAGLETANQGFDAVTYTGNGTGQSISNLSFQPDFVWTKRRGSAGSHGFFDSVRGATKWIGSNSTNSEQIYSDSLTSFDSNGFSVGADSAWGGLNVNGTTNVAWCWKAGGAAVSNTAGTITSSVSANTSYGFSIVSYTGDGSSSASIGHGLNSTPKWVIVKRTDSANAWVIAHAGIGTNNLQFDNSAAYSPSTGSGGGGISLGNSTTISPVQGTSNINNSNASGGTYVAYVWSEVSGFSKFSSYTGTGSSGQAITGLGFKPRFVLIKRTDTTENWHIFDTERGGTKSLFPDLSNAEVTDGARSITFTNDGFTLGTQGGINGSGGTYIYAAFADKPPGEIIDSLIDTPTDIEANSGNNPGNYATLNPLDNPHSIVLSNGNLDWEIAGTSFKSMRGNFMMSSGKWYFETKWNVGAPMMGIARPSDTLNSHLGAIANAGIGSSSNATYKDGSQITSGVPSHSTGDILMCAFDADAGKVWFGVNGSWYSSGDPAAGTNERYSGLTDGTWMPAVTAYNSSGSPASINFGQRPFAYTPPTGYKSLCTSNLPDPTISDPSQYFDTKLWTGTGASHAITGYNFSPDMAWIKSRSNASNHGIWDIVRGTNKEVRPNTTEVERTDTDTFNSFNSDGFTLGTDSGNGDANFNGRTFVGWAWDAGTSTVTNNDGSIASQVRANPSAGFSVVKAPITSSGGSIGHGLNANPGMLILKNIGSNSTNWVVWHSSFGINDYILLNSIAAKANSANLFNGNSTSTFTVGSGFAAGTNDFIAYCFAPVEGYSAFGSYTGNGSADGTFVYTGHRSRFLLIKATSIAGEDWVVLDTARETFNAQDDVLFPNLSSAEVSNSAYNTDILSNGFKLRGTNPRFNQSGATYIYASFAENPFKTARAR